MTFTPADILQLKIFCQHITMNPRPLPAQVYRREGVYLWCDDWEIIELLKYFFNGPDMYEADPPPNRLKRNPLWSKADIVQKAEALYQELETADKIIEQLKLRRGTS